MKKGIESPTDCLLHDQRTDRPAVLVASSFLVGGLDEVVPPGAVRKMHTALEELARLASPRNHALLLSIQEALNQPLAGLGEPGSARRVELVPCLEDIILRHPRGMGKSALTVRKLLSPGVRTQQEDVPITTVSGARGVNGETG